MFGHTYCSPQNVLQNDIHGIAKNESMLRPSFDWDMKGVGRPDCWKKLWIIRCSEVMAFQRKYVQLPDSFMLLK